MFSMELSCRKCGWRTICNAADTAARLRLIGLLRRDKEPSEDLLQELLSDSAPRMTCPACRRKGCLHAADSEAQVAEEQEWDDDWQAAVLCEQCRQPIPPERLEALPDSRLCVGCQDQSEKGIAADEAPDFCPKCGAFMELRVSRAGGLTRYKMFCTNSPPCRL